MAAKRPLRSATIHPVLLSLATFSGRALHRGEDVSSKAWNQNCLPYLAPLSGKHTVSPWGLAQRPAFPGSSRRPGASAESAALRGFLESWYFFQEGAGQGIA